jgi:F-type H+-transporting ATPase subunit b
MANAAPEVFATEAAQVLVEDGHGGAGTHSEPELWGLAPFQIVSLSMLVLLLIALFGAKVHKTIAGGLDGKIAAIKDQLDEAKQLRAEAEALRQEYAAKIAGSGWPKTRSLQPSARRSTMSAIAPSMPRPMPAAS